MQFIQQRFKLIFCDVFNQLCWVFCSSGIFFQFERFFFYNRFGFGNGRFFLSVAKDIFSGCFGITEFMQCFNQRRVSRFQRLAHFDLFKHLDHNVGGLQDSIHELRRKRTLAIAHNVKNVFRTVANLDQFGQ